MQKNFMNQPENSQSRWDVNHPISNRNTVTNQTEYAWQDADNSKQGIRNMKEFS